MIFWHTPKKVHVYVVNTNRRQRFILMDIANKYLDDKLKPRDKLKLKKVKKALTRQPPKEEPTKLNIPKKDLKKNKTSSDKIKPGIWSKCKVKSSSKPYTPITTIIFTGKTRP
jgi:hypothetical protein